MSSLADEDERDVREQLRLTQEALRKSERVALAGRFSGAIMHEINNPLEAITNLVYLAHLQADDPDRVRDYLRQAEEQLAIVQSIARKTLDFYRDKQVVSDVDLVELLEVALRIHTKHISNKRIDIHRRIPEKLIIQGNSSELLEVLSNLIVNALEALSSHGTLYIRLRSGKDEARMTVAETMAAAFRKKSAEVFSMLSIPANARMEPAWVFGFRRGSSRNITAGSAGAVLFDRDVVGRYSVSASPLVENETFIVCRSVLCARLRETKPNS
jgi:light-regulated signal transduction histidine kinase (bacteriophytochrome)